MNREFVYLNNKEVAVTDENGKITKRDAEFGMRDVLVSEDKLNDLNTNISCIKDCVKIEKKSIEIINKWYKVMAGVTIALAITAPITLGIVNGLGLIGAWTIFGGAACCYGVYSQRDSVKRINGYHRELKRAFSLRNQIKSELEFTRDLNKNYEVPSHQIGEVVKIDAIKDFEEQDKQLHRAFKAGYKNTPKVLVKTKNNK